MRAFGLTIILGTDAGIPSRPFDDFPADGQCWANEQAYGFSALYALTAFTSRSARVLGLTDRGMLEPGTRPDLLAVGGDPLANIADLANTTFMTAGRVVLVAAA